MIINYDDILKKLDSELDILEIEEADILVKAEKGRNQVGGNYFFQMH